MRWVQFAALSLAVLLAGCGSTTETTDPTSTSGTGTAASTGPKTSGGPSTGPGGHSVDLAANVQAGSAPLNVTFGLTASKDSTAWQLTFGDGSAPSSGGTMPAEKSHTYSIAGNFTATLNVTFKDGKTAEDAINIAVGLDDVTEPMPETHFEYGPAGGCDNSFTSDAGCVSFAAGPSQPPVDGHWQPVDNRYWGKTFTTTIEPPLLGDSDCFFVASDEKTVLGEANNVDQECGGVVPNNSAWIFLYSYVEPQTKMTMDFVQ